MFSLMACCFKWVKERREPRKQVTLVLIGLDNAGKTTTLKGVQGEPLETVAPTVGFSSAEFQFGKFDVTVFDLGGGKKIRDIWSNYYSEIHGVIFVIDASAEDRLQECKNVLEDALKKDRIRGKRILLLANKQDQEGALDEIDICDQLDLEEIVNNSKCPCRVETCSAVQGIGKKMDKSIREGFQWLLDGIGNDWPQLNERVERETNAQREEEAQRRKAKRERVMKEKAERERLAEEERKKQGLPEKEEPEQEEEMDPNFNPFKPLNDEYFAKKKESEPKENKKKLKKKADTAEDNTVEMDESQNTEKSDSVKSSSPRTKNDDDSDDSDKHGKPTGSGDTDRTSEHDQSNNDVLSEGQRSGTNHVVQAEVSHQVVVGSQENLLNASKSLTELPEGEVKKKKKKKKIKKNKTAPMPVDGIDEVAPPPLPTPLATPSWAQTPGNRALFKPSHKPTLAPLVEQNSPRQDSLVPSSTVNHRRRELPELRPRAMKPNLEDDDDVIT